MKGLSRREITSENEEREREREKKEFYLPLAKKFKRRKVMRRWCM